MTSTAGKRFGRPFAYISYMEKRKQEKLEALQASRITVCTFHKY